MKQNLPDLIRKNASLRNTLLAQEGGIMKFWAEHPDRDFDVDLFDDYENQIVEAYKRAHRRSREISALSKDELKRKAREWCSFTEQEFHYQAVLQPFLSVEPDEIKEQVNRYIDDYLVDADKDYLRCCYPDGIPPIDLYKGLVEAYRPGHMFFDYCLMQMFKEHYALSEWKMNEYDRYKVFLVWRRARSHVDDSGFKILRQAVKEMLDGKPADECRKAAVDMMKKVRFFSRVFYEDNADVYLGGHKVTAADREWLRSVAREYPYLQLSKKGVSHLHEAFAICVSQLMDVGRIWAARLLRYHQIDMHELEKETGVILFRRWGYETDIDYEYYVDKDDGDMPFDCCVYDKEQAKELLEKIKRDDNPPEELLIPEAQSEEVKGKTPVLSDDEKIVRAIAILNKEKLIKHKYDYTWVMQVMNETDGMPSYGSPQSFLTDMARLHIEGLPENSNMKKRLNEFAGKFPNWTFIDKDKTETDRRINIARRFYNAYRKGI